MDPAQAGRRWLIFNGVGLLGACLQLAVLAALLAATAGHELAATAVAVEAALLHNLWWHERWTWRDRPAAGRRARLQRALRFHLTNGGISWTGNILGVRLLCGGVDLHPLIASAIAIALCACANFALSARWVFRRPGAPPAAWELSCSERA